MNITKKIIIILFILSMSFIYFSPLTFATQTLAKPKLYSNNNLVMDAESGNVLFSNHGYDKVYPASTTKILTAILALENLSLDETIVASKNAIYSTPVGSSVAYIKVGEELTLKNLLYCLLMISGNDAANVVAEAVSGNMDTFINLMNEKLKEIGCNNTHFTNAHGFHDANHYTTPYDMALLMKYAIQNDTFREILETKEITIPKTNKSAERRCKSTNKMFYATNKNVYYEYLLGGKTGFTDEARGTFVGYGKKDDKTVIVASFDGSQNIGDDEARFLDTKTLFEFTFDNFNKYKIIDKTFFSFNLTDIQNKKIYTLKIADDSYSLCSGYPFYYNYDLDVDFSNITDKNINDKVGNIKIYTKGNNLNTVEIKELELSKVENYVKAPNYLFIAKYIILILLLIILFNILKKVTKKKRKNNVKHAIK